MQSASSHTHRRDSAVSQLVDNVMMLCANAALGHECPTLHKSSFTLALSFCFLFRDPHFLLFVVTCCSCCTFLHAMNAMVGLIFSYFRSLSCFSFTLCSLFICTGKQKQSSTSFLLHFFCLHAALLRTALLLLFSLLLRVPVDFSTPDERTVHACFSLLVLHIR